MTKDEGKKDEKQVIREMISDKLDGVEPFEPGEFKDADPKDPNQLQRQLATVTKAAVEVTQELDKTRTQDMWNEIHRLEVEYKNDVVHTTAIELMKQPDPTQRAQGAFLLNPDAVTETIRTYAATQIPSVVRGTKGEHGIKDMGDICREEIANIKKNGLMDAPIGVWGGVHEEFKRKGLDNRAIMPITPREYYRIHGINIRADETSTTLAYFVPVLYGNLIYTYAWEANPFRAGGATIYNVPTSSGKLPLLTGGYTGYNRTEGSATTDTNLTDAQLSFTNLIYSVYAIITNEILAEADIGVTMVSLIIQELGKAMGTLEATMGITGTGTATWYGLDSITAAKIYSYVYDAAKILDSFILASGSLGNYVKDANWRKGAGWMTSGHAETVLKLMRWGGAQPSSYVFPPNQGVSTLMGAPVAYNQYLESAGKSKAYYYVRPLYIITQEPKQTILKFDNTGRTNVGQNESCFFLNMKTQGQPATRLLAKNLQAVTKVTDIVMGA